MNVYEKRTISIVFKWHGVYDEKDVKDHYGLDEDDVEWYKIEEIK